MADAPLTVLELLRRAEGWFREQGVSSPRLDAEVILADVLGCRRLDLYLRFDQPVKAENVTTFRERSRDRARGKPVAYLLGRREFLSRSFAVDSRVLIPRPETEILVEEALRRAAAIDGDGDVHVVDVGAGSGAIALSVAAGCSRARVVAIDVSAAALEVARANAAAFGPDVVARVEFVLGDLLAPLAGRGLEGRVDLLLSNPPYVSDAEYARLPRDVKDHEPELALRAGPRGTELHERLFRDGVAYVRPGGLVLVEVGAGQAAEVRAIAETNGWGEVVTLRDFQGIERIVVARRV
ncbi:MAG: peptide chain release factor N(5)-glutamine methyltransferase [Planctomycetes bacterium]|nr:peptide chain release factor N(5)-glutamine methyltransferase [Planctomycetota bacterium]